MRIVYKDEFLWDFICSKDENLFEKYANKISKDQLYIVEQVYNYFSKKFWINHESKESLLEENANLLLKFTFKPVIENTYHFDSIVFINFYDDNKMSLDVTNNIYYFTNVGFLATDDFDVSLDLKKKTIEMSLDQKLPVYTNVQKINTSDDALKIIFQRFERIYV